MWLRDNNIHVDLLLTSAHKRAILSGKYAMAEYGKEVPAELLLSIHEIHGVYQGG